MSTIHTPVLLKECCDYLMTNNKGNYFDGTIGFGGHAGAMLEILDASAKYVATDVDNHAFNYSSNLFKDDKRVKLYNLNFSKISSIAALEQVSVFDGIFADLGVSSFQLDSSESGFSYRAETKLDLRLDKSKNQSAADVVNSEDESLLTKIFFEFGEEKNARKIARAITQRRTIKKFENTSELVSIIEPLTPPNYLNKTLSRVFQALRIYVNDELNVLKKFLSESMNCLVHGGRIAIITFHSLEDRIVKDFFKYESLSCICPKDFPVCRCDKTSRLKILTKKPISPSVEEIKNNRRARSAKLRVAERL